MIRLIFTTLAPLHISNGDQVGYGVNYVLKDRMVLKLNKLRISQLLAQKCAFDFQRGYSVNDLVQIVSKHVDSVGLEHCDYVVAPSRSFLDHIENERANGRKYYSEFVNANGQFYVPASSVKGALLTALGMSHMGIDHTAPDIKDRFVLSDSGFLSSDQFEILRADRPPAVSLLCMKRGTEFSMVLRKGGKLQLNQLVKTVDIYSKAQIKAALKTISKFKSSRPQPNGADHFIEALQEIDAIKTSADEAIVNLGFGGGSWMKVEAGLVPRFKNRNRRGRDEEAHTSFTVVQEDGRLHIGWCKLRIEDKTNA